MTASNKRRAPQQRRAIETRQRILVEARRAFAARGFDAANIRDIAEAADATHSMIRYHFGTKDQLWREAVREMFAQLDEALKAEPEDADASFEEQFRRFIVRYVRYCAENPEHARITIAETLTGSERLDWMVTNFVRPGHEALLPNISKLIERGSLPAVWPEVMIYVLVGTAQLPFVLAKEVSLSMGIDMTTEIAIQRHTDTIINLLFEGRGTAAP